MPIRTLPPISNGLSVESLLMVLGSGFYDVCVSEYRNPLVGFTISVSETRLPEFKRRDIDGADILVEYRHTHLAHAVGDRRSNLSN